MLPSIQVQPSSCSYRNVSIALCIQIPGVPLDAQEFAQRSIVAYVRSVFLQPNKDVFDVTKLPSAEYAQVIRKGLLRAPCVLPLPCRLRATLLMDQMN